MITRLKSIQTVRGQTLALLALLMVLLLGMLGLVLDGGILFARRRSAQNAADAGALAGARTLCLTQSESQGEYMARQYAITHNGASDAVANASLDAREVVVTATIPVDTFFLRFVGYRSFTAQASAGAGCFAPSLAESVLPVAWACRAPISDELSDSDDCQEQRITVEQLNQYIDNPLPPGEIYPELYVVMDSRSEPTDLEDICMSNGGYLECDLDGDGDDDLIANGDRSWLDLDGAGGGAAELIGWINGVNVPVVQAHTWMGGQSGTENSTFQAVGDHEGQFALLPIFNHICDDYPDPRCSSNVHAQDTILTSAGGNYYYHINGFATFYISCVDAPGVHHGECPGHKRARDLGLIASNTKTIEGYFILGFVPGLGGGPGGGGGVDMGAYTLYLTR